MNFVNQFFKLKLKIALIIIILLSSAFVTHAADLPALIMVYDDGYREDLAEVFPIHERYGVPAVTAVNLDYIGMSNWLDFAELHFLQSKGWEIANHGTKHAILNLNKVSKEINEGDQKISIKNNPLINTDYNYLLFNNSKNVSEIISIENKMNPNGKTTLELKKSVKHSYPKEGTHLRLTNSALKKEIIDSKIKLENKGLNIDTFVYPYNGYFPLVREIVAKNYAAARAGYRNGESFPEAFINSSPIKKYRLKAAAIESDLIKKSDIFKLLEETKNKKALLIFYAHPHSDNFEINRVKEILNYAVKNDIKITTFRELFSS